VTGTVARAVSEPSRPTLASRGTAVAAAVVADRLLADPPDRLHPVAWFGSTMAWVERRTWRDDRLAGAAHAVLGVGMAAALGRLLDEVAERLLGRRAGATFAVAVVALGGGGLDRAASRIGSALDVGDLPEARRLLPWLVGRDPDGLDEAEIARAVVESVAENTVDAVVAPVVWGLALGAPGVAVHRAANTLDAMVGHRSPRYERFGWASARVDDLANYVPARVGAALVAVARPRRAVAVWRAVRRDAAAHPSPNAGVIEAAFAAALDLRLGGMNRYGDRMETRVTLGSGRPPSGADIARARRLARDVGLAAVGLLVLPAVVARGRSILGASSA
jgi:adenosylcobinamide-phosphate synthase